MREFQVLRSTFSPVLVPCFEVAIWSCVFFSISYFEVFFFFFSSSGLSGSLSSSGSLLKEGQAVSAEVPGLASVLANLLCTLLPALQVTNDAPAPSSVTASQHWAYNGRSLVCVEIIHVVVFVIAASASKQAWFALCHSCSFSCLRLNQHKSFDSRIKVLLFLLASSSAWTGSFHLVS